ncbi:MAG: hypothetical protein ACIAQF_13485 [Phycisphaerales bacterium JB065]
MLSTRTAIVFIALAASALSGCTTHVTPPQAVSDPVTVYIVDYGRHSSVLLPIDQPDTDPLGRTTLREYAYGDWVYYANTQQSHWNGAKALLWNTRGTLGRRDLSGLGPASDEAPIEPAARIERTLSVERVFPVVVEREAATDLLALLDARFETGGGDSSSLYNPDFDLDFVPDEASYSVLHQCNHEVRDWLVLMGVEASGAPLVSEYKVNRRTP